MRKKLSVTALPQPSIQSGLKRKARRAAKPTAGRGISRMQFTHSAFAVALNLPGAPGLDELHQHLAFCVRSKSL